MASGTITGTTNNQYITSKIEWSSSPSVSANQSELTASLYVYKSQPQAYHTWGPGSWKLTAGSASKTFTPSVDLYAAQGWVLIGTLTTTIPHNADGSASVTISATGGIPGTSYTETYCSARVTLDNIPRASTMTISGGTMGSPVTFVITSASAAFTHSLTYEFGGVSGTPLSYQPAGTYSIPMPISLADQIPNATSGTVAYKLYTWNGVGVSVGVRTYTATLSVPASVKPTVTAVAISEAVAGLADKFGVFVQNKSRLAVAITAAGSHGSTIQSYTTKIQSRSYSGQSFTSDVLTAAGEIGVTVTVVDSRGRTDEYPATVDVTAYSPPRITTLRAWRIDTSGNEANDGERLALQLAYAVASVGGKNDCTLTVQYCQGALGTFETISSGAAELSYSGTVNYTDGPELSQNHTYTIQVTLADYFTSVFYTVEVPTAKYILHILPTKDGMGAGKAAEEPDLFDVAWNLRTRKTMKAQSYVNEEDVELLPVRVADYTFGADSNVSSATISLAAGATILNIVMLRGTTTISGDTATTAAYQYITAVERISANSWLVHFSKAINGGQLKIFYL